MPSEWRRREQVGSRGQGGTLPDKAVTPFNTSALPVISLYMCVRVCVWTPGLSWHRQHYHSYLPLPNFYFTHTSSSQHSADFTLKRSSTSSWVLTQAVTLTGTPDPPLASGDPWEGRRFKWFSSTFHHPVVPLSWLLMTTLEKGIMEIPQTIWTLDLRT